nr:hypothetical protein [Tanacetum cinerariifolium]
MAKVITNFRAGTITISPKIDSFLEDTEEEEKSMDDWDQLLDFNLDDIPLLGGEELSSFICKMKAGTITISPEIDSFLEDTEAEEKSMDDWDQLLDFNLDDIPLLGGEELSSFICKMK